MKQKRERLQHLEALNSLHDRVDEIQNLKKEINEALSREEVMWAQRSRALWMKWGDRNTKFFHATASQRRRRNSITGLLDSHGTWQEDPGAMEGIILDYFESIFRSDNPSSFEACVCTITPKVTPDMNTALCAEFCDTEVWNAFHQMHPTKAPGPDGMSPIFYQKYWDLVGANVIDCVLEILNTGVMPCGVNETYICLIPKTKAPSKISEHRSINLCNVIYKIVFKVHANRLKRILIEVIDESQSAFVPGRLITDNVLVAFETMHCIDGRKKGKGALMALKLDMNKAYDRMEWQFLEMIMRKLGFHER